MIIHYGSWHGKTPLKVAKDLDLSIGLVPPKVYTHKSYLKAIDDVADRIRLVDFQWYQNVGLETGWIEDTYGERSDLKRSVGKRRAFFRRIAEEVPEGPLTSIASDVDDGRRSTEYARELVALRNARYPDREVIGSIVISREGLSDPAVVAGLSVPPMGVVGVALSVMDVRNYPSVWTRGEWYGWLRMIRGLADAGYRVILPYSDVRGLVGLGAGASELGSGAQIDFRQLRPAQERSGSKGGNPSVSYMSVPLLSILHGTNASTEPNWGQIESHRGASQALGLLDPLHKQGASFDPEWIGSGKGQGDLITDRIRQHLISLAATEAAIVASSDPAAVVEQLLEDALAIGSGISTDVFRATGGKGELKTRLAAFRKVRGDLAF